MLEYARNFVTVVYPQRHGLGEHFSKDVECNTEGSATHGASLSPGVLGCDVGQSYSAFWRLTALDKIHNAIRSSPLLCFASCPGRQCADMILPAKLLMETSRMWPDRPLALIKLGIKKAFDQLYRSRVAAALEAASVAPEVALGLMHQMTGAKVMPLVGGRCCQEVPMERGIHQGRPESMDHFVLVLCYCLETCSNMVRVDIGGMLLAAWAHSDDLFWAAGAAWKLTRMLSDQSADLLRLGLSLCTEMGKCAWLGIGIDDLVPMYLAGNLVTRVTSFCVLGSMIPSEDDALVSLQHRTALAWGQSWKLKEQLRSRDTSTKSRLALVH